MEDLFASGPALALFEIFRHVEGYDGLPDVATVRAFVLDAEQTVAGPAGMAGRSLAGPPSPHRVRSRSAADQRQATHPTRVFAGQLPTVRDARSRAVPRATFRSNV